MISIGINLWSTGGGGSGPAQTSIVDVCAEITDSAAGTNERIGAIADTCAEVTDSAAGTVVAGGGDVTAPQRVGNPVIAADGMSIAVTYDETLASVPGAGVVTLGGTVAVANSSTGVGTTVWTIGVDIPILNSTLETVTITTSSAPADAASNVAANLSAVACTNNSTRYVSVEMSRVVGASDTWTSPTRAGVVTAECVGAGAGGITGFRAGGAGAYALQTFTFAPSTGYARVAGVGGAAGGTAGGNSTFNGTTCVAEGGGQSGVASDGGRASASTGSTKYDGGNGGVGAGTNSGGGSAGSGGAASLTTPGIPDGAPGTAGSTAVIPGGGGRGAAAAQGAGASGRVRTTWPEPNSLTHPNRIGVSQGRSAADGTNHSFTLPVGAVAGDRIAIFVTADGNPTITFGDAGLAAGVLATDTSTTLVTATVASKVLAGGDTLTFTTSASERVQWICVAERDSTGIVAAAANGSSATADSPNVSFGGTFNAHVYSFVGIDGSGTAAPGIVTAAPSGYDGYGFSPVQVPGATAGGVAINLTWETVSAQTARNPGAHANTNNAWVGITAAFLR